jgi:hypothetical protein
MKLCYIWIEQFKNFSNFEINLSSKYNFTYDQEKNLLNRDKLGELPKNFFPETFNAITGIIGKNGVGKSSALELICNVLKGAKISLKSDFFIILEERNKESGKDELKGYFSFSQGIPPKFRGVTFYPHPGSISDLKVIFFSNVFDNRRNDFDPDVVDLSANGRMGRTAHLTDLMAKDFRDQMALINSTHYRDLNIDTPEFVHIISRMWTGPGLMTAREFYKAGFAEIHEFRKHIRKRLRDLKNPVTHFIMTLKFAYFFEVVAKYVKRYDDEHVKNGIFNNANSMLQFDHEEPTEKLAQRLVSYIGEKFSSAPSLIKNSNNIFEDPVFSDFQLIERQVRFLSSLKVGNDMSGVRNYVDGARTRAQQNFLIQYSLRKEFIEGFSETMTYFETMSVGWLGISSGQRAYLNLFASLYAEIRNVSQPNMVLCIDEGDLYLHPRWQIEFFSKLMKVLPAIYQGKIQLVLTSHSPFLLTDLPRQNIEILNADPNSVTVEEDCAPTFGGNLYDLYAGPLFLGRDRSGIFSRDKIEELLKVVDKEKPSKADEVYIDRFLQILGDEILKFKIRKKLDMYDHDTRAQ